MFAALAEDLSLVPSIILYLKLQGIQHPLLGSVDIPTHWRYASMHANKNKIFLNVILSINYSVFYLCISLA